MDDLVVTAFIVAGLAIYTGLVETFLTSIMVGGILPLAVDQVRRLHSKWSSCHH